MLSVLMIKYIKRIIKYKKIIKYIKDLSLISVLDSASIKQQLIATDFPINKMTVKRRNHGRNKHGRGHVKRVR